MQVPLQQLKILDHPNLQVSVIISLQHMCIFQSHLTELSILYSLSQDGFGQLWSHDLLTKIIEEEVTNHNIHTV